VGATTGVDCPLAVLLCCALGTASRVQLYVCGVSPRPPASSSAAPCCWRQLRRPRQSQQELPQHSACKSSPPHIPTLAPPTRNPPRFCPHHPPLHHPAKVLWAPLRWRAVAAGAGARHAALLGA
jgi:hypothetical protein